MDVKNDQDLMTLFDRLTLALALTLTLTLTVTVTLTPPTVLLPNSATEGGDGP